ncbi:TPA: polysaccharide pyruvyl transferase family protein [Clostridium perfringens]
MKVRIEHASNPLNYGTNMMVTNFIYYINQINENITFLIDANNDDDLNRYINNTKLKNIDRETIDYNLCISNNFVERVINKLKRKFLYSYFYKKEFLKLKRNTEILIVLGGDDISEYYGVEGLEKELRRIDIIKKDIKVFLVGQTIGPFSNDERKNLVKNTLDGVEIYSRDNVTKNYMDYEIGIDKVIKSSDLAFLDLPNQSNHEIESNILKKYNLDQDYITIVPSGLSNCYCDNKETYINKWVSIINDIRTNYPSKNFVLLAHVLVKTNDDREVIRSIYNRLDNKNKIIQIIDEITPLQARFILGNGDLTITGRMHAAISTFQMGKPAISLSYSIKYSGVIGEGLGLKDLVIESSGDNYWENNYLNDSILQKIDYVYKNEEKLLCKIKESVNICKSEVLEMINDISYKLKNL